MNSIYVLEVTFTLNGKPGEAALAEKAAKALQVNPLFKVMYDENYILQLDIIDALYR